MKYIAFVSVLLLILIIGCQSLYVKEETPVTKNNQTPIKPSNTLKNIASTNDIYQAILAYQDTPIDKDALSASLTSVDDVWQRIRQQFVFEYKDNLRIATQRNWFIKHPRYFKQISQRAAPFLYYIVTELEKNNIPLEIALLPIVESAFDPFAYSHGQASGIWQFVPQTGQRYGMKQNWWYDGRRDIISSTQGAIKYLQYLHQFFDGDWLLALAAYNSGEGRVRRAVRRNKKKNIPTDFWSLDLPKETRDYVPKLLALVDIVKNQQMMKVRFTPINNAPALKNVDIGSQIDLATAAELAQISLSQLQMLNPAFNHWATAPKGPYRLLIPVEKADIFKQSLAKIKPGDRISWQRYKIKRGDSLGKIAHAFNTNVSLIKELNNLNSNQIRANEYLLIPTALLAPEKYIHSTSQRLAKMKKSQYSYHVKHGDTLWDIAHKYKVSVKNLAKWNNISSKNPIRPQQKLIIR